MSREHELLMRPLLLLIVALLLWLTLRPHVAPSQAEAGREAVIVNIERIGGRFLSDGALPVRCADLRP